MVLLIGDGLKMCGEDEGGTGDSREGEEMIKAWVAERVDE